MKRLCRFFPAFFVFCIAFSVFAQESKLIVVNKTSKELKRSAHRLRIPVEQLKKARQTLQEATDLVRTIKPFPIAHVTNLATAWQQLNRSGAKAAVTSFVQDLRSEATKATDPQTYMQATSTAMSLMQMTDEPDYEKVLQILRSWPEPPESIAEATGKFRDDMLTSTKNSALWRLANTDPDKALTLLTSDDSGEFNYAISGQIAQGLMNSGKKDEAISVIEQTIADFSQNATDPRALQAYESFVQMSVNNLDPGRAAAAMNPLITQLSNQAPSGDCGATLKVDDNSVELTCAELKVLNLVRSIGMRPVLTQTTLDSVPALKSKLDGVGGIDSLYSNTGMSMTYGTSNGRKSMPPVSNPFQDSSKLIQELKGKAQSNPGYVKTKLQEVAKNQQGIDILISLAMMASYQDDELASMALETAQQLFPQVTDLQRRSTLLQNLIQAYRQIEGEVDEGLLKNGFILADELREEQSEQNGTPDKMNSMKQWGYAPADQLEAQLVSELAKDSFEDAIRYARSMKNDPLKLMCLIQIAQALSQSIH